MMDEFSWWSLIIAGVYFAVVAGVAAYWLFRY
jgi:hypothetical protein